MRILRVDAHAFGPFRGETLELAGGMNLVFGPNEAGKSSWHAALYAGLCGVRRGRGAPRAPDRDFADRHRPWEGESWEAGVRVQLTDGRTIELRHDLAGLVDCWAKELGTGTDISDRLMNEQTPDGSRLLGLTRDVMLATACVRQAQVLDVVGAPERLQEHLQAAATSGGGDVTAQAAIERLERFRKEVVGTERTRTAPLDEATRALELASARAADAEAAHHEYLELVRQHEEAQEQAERARAALIAGRLAALERRLDRARALAEDLPDELPDPREERQLASRVGDALSLWNTRPAEPERPDGPTVEELEARIAQLPERPEGDTEAHETVTDAEAAWRTAVTRLDAHREQEPAGATIPARGVDGSALRHAADELAVPVPDVDPELERRVTEAGAGRRSPAVTAALVAGGVLTVLGLLLVAAGTVAVGVVCVLLGLAAGGWGWWSLSGGTATASPEAQAELALQRQSRRHAQERREEAAARVETWGLDPDPDALRRLAARLDDAAGAAERRRSWEERRDQLRAGAEEAEQRLRTALASRGAADASDPQREVGELTTRYRSECRDRAERAGRADQREHLAGQLEARRRVERAVVDDRTKRERAEEAVRAAAAAVGVDRETSAGDDATGARDRRDVAELAARLAAWRDEQERESERIHELHRRRATLDELLAGQRPEDLAAEAGRLRGRLASLPDPGRAELADDVDATLGRLQEREQRTREHVADLRGRVATVEETLVDVAEAQEEVRRVESEVARLRALGTTVDTTLEFLLRARERVQRDIAPRLADAVAEHLPRLTGGRYTEAAVDPERLAVEIRDVEGRWRSATLLSRGTAEQIHLLLRLAMTEHLVTTDEPAPLILDDVTVQSDRARTTAFLDLLHDLSVERQVIVFSQELEVLDWAEGRLKEPDDRITTLPPPAGASDGGW